MVDYRTTPGASVTPDEREYLKNMVDGCGCIVNIGVGRGASIHCLRAGAPDAVLYGIDLNNSLLIGNPNAILITGNSNDPAHVIDAPIDLLFIDGAHDFKCVLHDVTLWTKGVRVGGVVIFHDYFADVFEAVVFWLHYITHSAWEVLKAPDSLFALRRVS